MPRLTDTDLKILAVVAKFDRICIGLPLDEQCAPIADGLEKLSRQNPGLLVREDSDDGPTYSISPAGRAKLLS